MLHSIVFQKQRNIREAEQTAVVAEMRFYQATEFSEVVVSSALVFSGNHCIIESYALTSE